MKSKHTTGEWSINTWTQRDACIRIGAPGTPVIAELPLQFVSINEQKANADLVAAAPKMLEAMRAAYLELLKIQPDKGPRLTRKFQETLCVLRNTIASAQGTDTETVQVWHEQRAMELIINNREIEG